MNVEEYKKALVKRIREEKMVEPKIENDVFLKLRNKTCEDIISLIEE